MKGVEAILGGVHQALQAAGHADLTVVKGGQIDGSFFGQPYSLAAAHGRVDVDLIIAAECVDGLDHQRLGYLQQCRAGLHQFTLRHVDVTVVRLLAQRVGHAGCNPFWRVEGDPLVAGDLVGGDEADTMYVPRQTIRIVGDYRGRTVAVLFVDAHSQRRADAVALEKNHHLADLALFVPGSLDLPDAFWSHPKHLVQLIRVFVDNRQRIGAELTHDAFGGYRSNPLDQAAAQVFLDTGGCGRQYGGVAFYFELAAMLDMNRPFPFDADMLADTDAQHVPDDSNFIVLVVGNQPGDGIAGFLVVKGETLEDAFKGLHSRSPVG